MFNKKKNKKKGFTLVELLVVILIIGVVAGISLPMYFSAVEKTRATESLTLLGTIAKAQQRYKTERDRYSTDIRELDLTLKDYSTDEDAIGNEFDSEYFNYTLLEPSLAKAKATRKNDDYSLYIDYKTNEITCKAASEDNHICLQLALAEEVSSAGQTLQNTANPDFECSYGELMALSPKLLMSANTPRATCRKIVENGFTKVALCQTALAVESQECTFLSKTENGYTVQYCTASGVPTLENCIEDNGRYEFQEDSEGNLISAQYCRGTRCYYTMTYETDENGIVHEVQEGSNYFAEYSVLPDGTAVQRNCLTADCSVEWSISFSQESDGTLIEITDWMGSLYRNEVKAIDDHTTIIGGCSSTDACTSYDDIIKRVVNSNGEMQEISCQNPVGLTCPEWDE